MAEKKRSLRLVGKNEPITTESVVGAPENFEDEFDILLDAESDEEFGVIDFREHNSPGGDRAVLKTWTSQDFSNIYVRFRPHLERYARRWLNNQSQIDEVVQDAFLYLMVTLPDLDSELGVLRFLKWKLRLLCLDVMRASGKAYINNIDDHSDDLAADLPEASAALEAADDAAVVRLALSKLTPRHREVLLATMYEEKSIAEVAAQVQLSENATRQLIFRARAAFKAALVGDVDTSGMSAGAILSVAARKAAAEAKKVGVQAMALFLFFAIGLGSYFGMNNGAVVTPQGTVAQDQVDTPVTDSDAGTGSSGQEQHNDQLPADDVDLVIEPVAFITEETIEPAVPTPEASPVTAAAINVAMNQSAPTQVTVLRASKAESTTLANRFSVMNQTGKVSATFDYSKATGMQNVTFSINIDGVIYHAYGVNTTVSNEAGRLVLTGTLSDLVAPDNTVISDTALGGATVRLEFNQSDLVAGAQSASLLITAVRG